MSYTPYQEINTTPFSEQLTAERTTIMELKSIYGISNIRDRVTTTNTGTVTNDFREYKLNVNGSNSQARITSVERGRYIPGKSAEYGIGIRTETSTLTGDTVMRWGALNDTNGMFFGLDSNGIFVSILDNEVEIPRTYQKDWNLDKLDGTGPSREKIDLTKANIFQIEYTWYGYGVINFKVQLKTLEGMKIVTCHRYIVDSQVSVGDPNLPITVDVNQTGSANNASLFIAGRQFSVLGSYTPSFRSLSDYVIGKSVPVLTGEPTPIISFKQKEAYANVVAKLSGIDLVTNNSVMIEVYVCDEGDITGASFVTPTRKKTNETSFEVDKSASAVDISNANLLYRLLLKGGDRNTRTQGSFDNILLDVPEGKVLVITGFALGSTATVDGVVNLIEEW